MNAYWALYRDLVRTFELYKKTVKFSPVLGSETEFAVFASDDMLQKN